MAGKPTAVGPPSGSAVLVLAEAICDAQLIIAESFEQDLPDAPRTLTSFASSLKTKLLSKLSGNLATSRTDVKNAD
jgi:hypothetical protein